MSLQFSEFAVCEETTVTDRSHQRYSTRMTECLRLWRGVNVSRSNRPIFLGGEYCLFVKDAIGLYQGKQKIINRQDGRVYLTNRRVIYIDSKEINKSVSFFLEDVYRTEVVEKFLKKSAKVKLYISDKAIEGRGAPMEYTYKDLVAQWVCVICSFSNEVRVSTDLEGNFPRCASCGIKPTRQVIEQAIECKKSKHANTGAERASNDDIQPKDAGRCPRCTFMNHPELQYCEMCGGELLGSKKKEALISSSLGEKEVTDIVLQENTDIYDGDEPYVQLSFRKGGEAVFNRLALEAMDNIKWQTLVNRNHVNENGFKLPSRKMQEETLVRSGGIHGLEKISEQQRRKNEVVLSSSLQDLEQLMHKYQDLLKLTVNFGRFVGPKQTSGPIIPPMSIKKTSSLYPQELARHMSEYLTNYKLTKKSSMVTTQDLFASYNRYLVEIQGFGTELVTVFDFKKALKLFDLMDLPVTLRKYEKSGLLVLRFKSSVNYSKLITEFVANQETIFSHEKEESNDAADKDDYVEDQFRFFRGCSIPQICEGLGWSYPITMEEIESCIESGALVVDSDILGSFYYLDQFPFSHSL